MTDTTTPSAEIERTLAVLPAPVDLGRALTARVNDIVAAGRDARRAALGDGHDGPAGPDAVRPLALELAHVHDRLHDYATAIEGAARTALGHLGDEQREAHGAGDDDKSAEPLHLLDDDGATWTISDRVQAGWASNDLDGVFEAVASVALAAHSDNLLAAGVDETEASVAALRALVLAALAELVAAGKYEPQVTKVKGKGKLADRAARTDAPSAARARGSMYRTERVTGTKIERIDPDGT